jgi:hypothetical protein
MGTRTILMLALACIVAVAEAAAQAPSVSLRPFGDTLYWYANVPLQMRMRVAPPGVDFDVTGGATVEPLDPANGEYLVTIASPPMGVLPVCAEARRGKRVSSECITVASFVPEMYRGIDNWGALTATVGAKYDPSSEWVATAFPPAHYQTVVEVDGAMRLNMPGVRFDTTRLPSELRITERTRSVRTKVYWKPNGTSDFTQWVLLASTDGAESPRVPLATRQFAIVRE